MADFLEENPEMRIKNRRERNFVRDDVEVPPRFELGVELLQSSALPLGYGTELEQICSKKMERVTRLELATSTLARWRSTR